MRNSVASLVALILATHLSIGAAQNPPVRSLQPVDPITSIIEAFRTHDIVALSDPHGNVQVQAFLLSLVKTRLQRLTFGSPVHVQNFKRACGLE